MISDSFEIINVEDDGRPILMLNYGTRILIDSGANRNIWISTFTQFKRYMKQRLGRVDKGLRSFTGDSVYGDAYLSRFEIGKFKWCNSLFIIPDKHLENANYDALLGTSLFKEFVVSVDYKNGVVTLTKYDDNIDCSDSIFERSVDRHGSINAFIQSFLVSSSQDEVNDYDVLDDLAL